MDKITAIQALEELITVVDTLADIPTPMLVEATDTTAPADRASLEAPVAVTAIRLVFKYNAGIYIEAMRFVQDDTPYGIFSSPHQ